MGKIQLTNTDKERLYEEFPYLDAPDVGIHIGLDNISHIESPFDEGIFQHHVGDLRYAMMSILGNPTNMWLTVKMLLGISLEPMQVVQLVELWEKSYPMLVASRGAGKCITEDAWIVKDNGFARIGDIINPEIPDMVRDYKTDLKLLGENGFNEVEYAWSNGKTETIKLTTSWGYHLEGTKNHPIRVVRDGDIVWVNMEDIQLDDRVPIHRGTEWFPHTNNLTIDEGYLMGLLVGDGGYTVRGRISFTTADPSLIHEVNRISQILWNKQFKKQSNDKYTHTLWGVAIWDELFQKYGFNSPVCGEKDIPSSILSAKKEVVAAFIRGLADTDASCDKRGIQFSAKSEKIIKSLQFLFTRFGIVSKIKCRYNKKYDRYYWYLNVSGEGNKIFQKEIGFGLKRKQDRLDKFCSNISNTNKDLIPHELIQEQLLSLRNKLVQLGPIGTKHYSYIRQLLSPSRIKRYELSYNTLQKILSITNNLKGEPEWIYLKSILDKHYFYDTVAKLESSQNNTYDIYIPNNHSFVSNGLISHNSFLLSVYIILRCVFTPGCRVVIIGFGLRQSRNLYNYVEKMWRNAPLLREMVKSDSRSGPAQKIDRYVFIFGESTASFLPLGACLTKDTLVTYDDGFGGITKHHDKKPNKKIWSHSGMKEIGQYYINGNHPTKKITTQSGYSIEGTTNHKIKVLENNQIIWKELKEVKIGDYAVMDRTYRWHQGDFQCTPDEAYALGAMIGDGNWTQDGCLRYATRDIETINRIENAFGKKWTITSDGVHYDLYGQKDKLTWLNFWGLTDKTYTIDKKMPDSILSTSREMMTECIKGLMDSDGCVITLQNGSARVIFTNTSKALVEQLHFILTHYGIIARKTITIHKNAKWNTRYDLIMDGIEALKYYQHIGFSITRKQEKLKRACEINRTYQSDSIPINRKDLVETAITYQRQTKPTNINCRVSPNKLSRVKNITFNLVDLFRKRYGEMDKTLDNKLKEISNPNLFYEKITDIQDGEADTFDLNVPEENEYSASGFLSHNSGATVRGERAEYIIIDEYGDVPKTIVDTVVAGFAAVAGDPIGKRNLIARIKRLKSQGRWDNNKEREIKGLLKSNQIILSGTAKFHFNHFAQDWIRYKEIIQSGGNKEKLKQITGEEDENKLPNPEDYSVIRIPYTLIPEGIMDTTTIHRTKTSSNKAIFEQEYEAIFSDDSDGFFKAKLLNQCTANNVIEWSGVKITEPFEPFIRGKQDKKYILGFDPAAEVDNAAIIILELNDTHCKVVYCWTINKKEYEKEIMSLVGNMTYYNFCAWKIAQLHRRFNFCTISIDAQGGGVAVAEILERNQEIRGAGMPPLLPVREGHVLWDNKERPTDDIDGEHIIELVQFANAKWNSEAHHGLRSDLEGRRVIFPLFDALSVDVDEDRKINLLEDNTADISMEIEQLKYELTIIEHTVTPGGNRERWDTPEVKQDNDKKGRLRNDRASALVMANMAARRIRLAYPEIDYFSEYTKTPRKKTGPWKSAPGWFKEKCPNGGVFRIIK